MFTPVSPTTIRMEACTLVQFKTTNEDMKEVVSAEIIKEQVSSEMELVILGKSALKSVVLGRPNRKTIN